MTVINTNVKALVAQDSMRQVNLKLATAMERLSTGLRINSAKDDAAGLAISERMNAQVRGLGMAIKNANDGLSMSQTADGAYGEVTSMLQRMRELAVQAATGSMSKLDRESIQLEIEELKAEIENVATKTHFNNIKLLDGTAQDVTLQVGANQGDTIKIGFDSVRAKDIGSGDKPALTSLGGDAESLDKLEAGDLVINGVLVNSSLRTDDNLSYGPREEVQTITFASSGQVGTFTITVPTNTDGVRSTVDVAVSLSAANVASFATLVARVKDVLDSSDELSTVVASVTVSSTVSEGVLTINFEEDQGDLDAIALNRGGAFVSDDSLEIDETQKGISSDVIAASAIAKAAAINRVAEQSGVTAKVNDTTVQGSTMISAGPTAAAAITINGVSTADLALGLDKETNRGMVVTAINNLTAQTGVRAVNTGDDMQGVLLVADDGRNITVEFEGELSANNTGLSTSGTFVGTFSLYSANGSPIKIDHQVGKDLSGTGLRIGTYEADMATMVSLERSGSGTIAAANAVYPQLSGTSPSATSGSVGVLNGDTLVINDISIGAARATDDTASISTTASAKAASAIAVAAAINKKSDLHGVVATAEPNVIRSETEGSFIAGSSGIVNLNGVNISVSTATRSSVIDSINQYSGQTGVVARVYGEGVELVAEDGRNIVIGTTSNISAANLGLSGVSIGSSSSTTTVDAEDGNAFYASVRLSSEQAFTVARGSEGGDNFSRLGFREGLFGGNYTGMKIAEVDVSSQDGASVAITAIDAALEDVYAAQAKSGAYQNRLDAIINVLSESTENLQASRSRILDTDYALEATNLAKAQIVSQAATAMLAQANQSQQTVLSLLQ